MIKFVFFRGQQKKKKGNFQKMVFLGLFSHDNSHFGRLFLVMFVFPDDGLWCKLYTSSEPGMQTIRLLSSPVLASLYASRSQNRGKKRVQYNLHAHAHNQLIK